MAVSQERQVVCPARIAQSRDRQCSLSAKFTAFDETCCIQRYLFDSGL